MMRFDSGADWIV